jgi:hypothetical protein
MPGDPPVTRHATRPRVTPSWPGSAQPPQSQAGRTNREGARNPAAPPSGPGSHRDRCRASRTRAQADPPAHPGRCGRAYAGNATHGCPSGYHRAWWQPGGNAGPDLAGAHPRIRTAGAGVLGRVGCHWPRSSRQRVKGTPASPVPDRQQFRHPGPRLFQQQPGLRLRARRSACGPDAAAQAGPDRGRRLLPHRRPQRPAGHRGNSPPEVTG